MTFNQIIALTVNALSQRGVNADLTTTLAANSATDLSASIAGALVNLGQLELQRRHDFDCMKAATQPTYTTGGLALAATVKRAFAVYYKETGAASQAIRGCQIWPASEADVIRIGLQHHRRNGQQSQYTHGYGGCWFPGGESALDLQPGRTVWWMIGDKLVLGRADCRDDGAFNGTVLWVDAYTLLTPYAAAGDTDWFTQWGPEALMYQAAAMAGEVGQEDDRAMMYQERADKKAMQLVELDQRKKVGAQADIVLAPTRGYRMAR